MKKLLVIFWSFGMLFSISAMEEQVQTKLLTIHEYSKEGNLAKVEQLLAEGVLVDIKNGNGWTALMYAALGGYKEVAFALLAAGAIDTQEYAIGEVMRKLVFMKGDK